MAEVKVFKEAGEGADITGKIVTRDEGRRPVYRAAFDTTDTYTMALADIIFWSDQLREHASFMQLLLPIENLPDRHEQAIMFKGAFETLFERALTTPLARDDIRDLSLDFVGQVQPLVKFKRRLEEEQRTGKIHSLLWPLFLDHIAREAERSMGRQEMFMAGTPQFDREEIINFWSQIMAEHADFIAHLLDPQESDLISKAMQGSDTFKRIQREHGLEERTDPVTLDIDHFIDFKTAAVQGIETGQIRSIITPDLADHVRREAVVFSDELRRADMMANIEPKAA